MPDKIERRVFIKSGISAGAGVIGGALISTTGKSQVLFRRSAPDSRELVRVGVLCCGPDAHINNTLGGLINPTPGKIRQTGMIMTYCWDIDPAVSETFARRFGCTAVKNYYDMIGKIDAVIQGGYTSHPVNHKLVAPYLEARIPTYVNRPFTNSLTKARIVIEKAKAYRTPLMCGSAFEFTREAEIIRAKVKEWGNITGYSATNAVSDYSTHGIHGVYACYRCIGGPVTSVAYQTGDWHNPNGLLVFEHPGREGGRTFYGTLQQIPGGFTNWSLKLWNKEGEFFEQCAFGEKTQYDRDNFLWAPFLMAIQRMFEWGEMPEPYENILEKTAVFLTGFKSNLDHNGAPVKMKDLPPDWEAPSFNVGRYGYAMYDEKSFD